MAAAILYLSEVSDGHMGVSASKNRSKFFKKNKIDPKKVIDAIPSHGNKIKIVTKKDGGNYFEGCDGLISKDKEIFLALTCADCMPLCFFDPTNNSIALIHCGWRGLENGIITKTVSKFFSSSVHQLAVYIGPHICKKHYEIKKDVSIRFSKYASALYFKGASCKNRRTFLDLGVVVKQQLVGAGIKVKNINMDPRCSYESEKLFSYRRGDLRKRNLYLLTQALNVDKPARRS